jgi:5-enolpyruvylshikimate-3-phosphate synthase
MPAENRVVIYNEKTGDAWSATFALAAGAVTFSNVKSVTISAESARKRAAR